MKMRTIKLLALLISVLIVTNGCGDFRGPGTEHAETSGGRLVIGSFSHNPQFDCWYSCCYDLEAEKYTCETLLTDETVDFTVTWEPFENSSTKLPHVTLMSYRLEYYSDDYGAVPLTSVPIVNFSAPLGEGDSYSTKGTLLMPMSRKCEFTAYGGDMSWEPVYELRISMFGVDDYGYEVSGSASIYATLSEYLRTTCKGSEILFSYGCEP